MQTLFVLLEDTSEFEDFQEIGIDGDGCVICWDATTQTPYNTGELPE